jgi:hypothetical protein
MIIFCRPFRSVPKQQRSVNMSKQINHRLYVCPSIYLEKTTSRSVSKSVMSAYIFISLSGSQLKCLPALSAHLSVPSGAVVTLFGRGRESRARIFKRLRSPGIDSKESIQPRL